MTLFTGLTIAILAAGILLFSLAGGSFRKTIHRYALWYFVVLVFLALVIHLMPLSYEYYRSADTSGGTVILIILQSIQNTLRTFVLDGAWGEWMSIRSLAPGYSLLGIILSVAAPILTFSVILSALYAQFSRISLRVFDTAGKPLHIMSELNERSLALAVNVTEDYRERRRKGENLPRPRIYFTDVFERNEEENYELRRTAKDLGASFIKSDIRDIDLGNKKGFIHFYVLGENEKENLSQAVTIYRKYEKRQRIKLFVWAREDSAYLLDAHTKDALSGFKEERFHAEDVRKVINAEDYLIFRRIYEPEKLAASIVPEMGLFEKKDPSILILGAGKYGESFFRMLLWYLQREGSCPEINVIEEQAGFREQLKRMCPELVSGNNVIRDGDAAYSYAVYENTDVFGGFLQDTIGGAEKSEAAQRILKTDAVIIALGEDQKNLSAAVYMREILARKEKRPKIYVVIEDDALAKTVRIMETTSGEHLEIIPIGCRSEIDRFGVIFNKETESRSFAYHNMWVETDLAENRLEGGRDEAALSADYENNTKNNLISYEQKEYFRNSSISRALHSIAVEKLGLYECENGYTADDPRRLICTCGACMLRRKQEHMRWNAYMRTQGYVYGARKDHLAKTHPNLVPFSELSDNDKIKDS